MKKNKHTKKIIIITIPSLIVGYFLLCFMLYIFEPISYHAPDLSEYAFCFDLYDNYSKDKDSLFYIKKIDHTDVSAATDVRLKYIKDTILLVADANADFSDVSGIASNYHAEIDGYIADANFYQLTFTDTTYDDLINICSSIKSESEILAAIPDYFEETPEHEFLTESEIRFEETYPNNMLNINALQNQAIDTSNIKIGMIDSPVDYQSKYLNIADKDYSDAYTYDKSHGTAVAGIMSASTDCSVPGVCPGAQIYSHCGLNNSVSYWIASLCDLIVHDDIRAINISMGYNSFIPISASLGCEASKEYVEAENEFFSAFLSNLLSNDYDFLICVAAGNSSNKTLYKVSSDYFSYGEKKILPKLDKFGIFSVHIDKCEAKYGLFLSDIKDVAVREHIMIVAACNKDYDISTYSNVGDAVDIAAPGDFINTLAPNGEYDYLSGTSMATPYVTATAVYLYAINPELKAADVKNILLKSSTGTVTNGLDTYNVLNAGNAVKLAVKTVDEK